MAGSGKYRHWEPIELALCDEAYLERADGWTVAAGENGLTSSAEKRRTYIYFEEGAGPTIGNQSAHGRRSPPHRRTSPSCRTCCGGGGDTSPQHLRRSESERHRASWETAAASSLCRPAPRPASGGLVWLSTPRPRRPSMLPAFTGANPLFYRPSITAIRSPARHRRTCRAVQRCPPRPVERS